MKTSDGPDCDHHATHIYDAEEETCRESGCDHVAEHMCVGPRSRLTCDEHLGIINGDGRPEESYARPHHTQKEPDRT